ncbi:MAG: FG-GAP-like repeat-containing protein [Vicinamibacterales bacterium]
MTRVVPALCSALLLSMAATGQQPPRDTRTERREEAYRHNNVGVARLEQYDYAGAAAELRRALELRPDLAMARLNLALALLYDGQLDAAAREGRAALERIESMAQPHFVLGLIARADNRLDDAAAAFQRAIDIDPADAGSRLQLGQVRLAQRRFADAASLFESALTLEPFNATAAYGLAQALTRVGDRARGGPAMARFQALRDNPAAITYSSTYLEQGRYGEAIVSTGIEPELIDASVPPVAFSDATASMLPARGPAARDVSLADIDADGDADLLVAADDGVHVLRNTGRRFETAVTIPITGAISAIAGDYDNDGAKDLLVLTERSPVLVRQERPNVLTPATGALPAGVPAARTAAFVDADHDGDLDIVAGARLLRNNGNGRFQDVTAESGLPATSPSPVAVVPTDFDNRRDVDLLFVGRGVAPALLRNQRDGTFRDVAAEVGLPRPGQYTGVAVADINKDLAPDFFFGRAGAAGVMASSGPGGRFALADAPAGTRNAGPALFVDYDNDGLPDLVVSTPDGPRLWRSAATRWIDASTAALPARLVPAGDTVASMSAADLDGDGDMDLVVRLGSGSLRVWRNEGGNRNASVRVRLRARVSNRDAVGAKIELRAGSLRQKLETYATTPPVAPADLLFGLGARAGADVVRVLWPAGILQAETAVAARVATIEELDRKPSSCPFLYTWNGSRFEFVTDFLGGGELGYWVAPGVRGVPDPDEYVRIPADGLRARDGRYELRVTNELEEALFVDRLELIAVAHPAGAGVHPNEGLRSPERREPFTLYTVRDPGPPLSAVDHHGHDVRDRLAARDRIYVDDFRRSPIQGYAEEHAVTFDTGARPSDPRVLLLLTGWTDYAFSSDNVAAHQAGLAFRPPELHARDATGHWRLVLPEIGLPVGRPQTVVVDVTPQTRTGAREFRIVTTLRVYWDQILVDTSAPSKTAVTRIDADTATLGRRGFSLEVRPDGREPAMYDYDRVSPDAPWKLLPGRYTREGDVRPLVAAVDDQFVIAAPGDEIAVSFAANAFPPPPDGWTHTFLLYAVGFSKEMNLHSASPDRLEPLPFHGMHGYPYGPSERYPDTPEHRRYRSEYNTRAIGRNLPPLERTR